MARGKKTRRISRVKSARLKARHRGDPVSIQISVRLKRIPKGMKITKKLLADMIRHKAATSSGAWDGKRRVLGGREGNDPKGIEIKIIRWKNPDREFAKDRAWRTGSQAAAWGSLRQAIENASINFR